MTLDKLPDDWVSYKIQSAQNELGSPTENTIRIISLHHKRDIVKADDSLKNQEVELLKKGLEKKALAPDTVKPDELQCMIDKHKELLQAKKDNDSYSRNVKDQTKEINQIRAEISALQGVLVCPIYFNCWKLLRALYNNITMKYGCM